jgi:hypothetical protein
MSKWTKLPGMLGLLRLIPERWEGISFATGKA